MSLRMASREGAADQLHLRPLTEHDLTFATTLHRELLSHGFFGRLGGRFLRSYYRTFVVSPYGHGEIALLGNRPVGVLVGTFANREHYAWVLRRLGAQLVADGVLGLFTHPRELALFVRTRLRRYVRSGVRMLRGHGHADGTPAAGSPTPVAVLTHVCVSPAVQGSGVGTALVRSFCEQAREAGAVEAQLVTLADQRGAARFYRREGWSDRGFRTGPDGERFQAFARDL